MDEVYAAMWASYNEEFRSPSPSEILRSWSSLYQVAVEAGLGAASRAIDIGCGRGDHTRQLAARTKCNITGVDLVLSRLQDAAHCSAVANNGFIQATIQQLPLRTAAFDFVWCCDMLMHVRDLPAALTECFRILRPGGKMLLVTILETDRMEPGERARLCRPLLIHPESLCRFSLERYIAHAGFAALTSDNLGAELIESQHEAGEGSYDLLKLARLRRTRPALLRAVNPSTYETVYAFHEWIVYQLLGKLSAAYYLLQRPA